MEEAGKSFACLRVRPVGARELVLHRSPRTQNAYLRYEFKSLPHKTKTVECSLWTRRNGPSQIGGSGPGAQSPCREHCSPLALRFIVSALAPAAIEQLEDRDESFDGSKRVRRQQDLHLVDASGGVRLKHAR